MIERTNAFLKLIGEISKNDIEIDPNLVYSNLINYDLPKEDITLYIDMWIKNFEKLKNVNITKQRTYIKFNSFNYKNDTKKIKLHIPLDKKHIDKGMNEIINFLSQNNIVHSTKVFNTIRNDNIVISVDDLFTAEKIREFIDNNNYIKEGLLKLNPFMFTDGNISYVWDGYLTYNIVLCEWISDFVNELKKENKLDKVNYRNFIEYLNQKYESIFNKGIDINKFITTRKFINIKTELLNYKYITNIIINSINPNAQLKDFCYIIKNINEDTNKIKTLIASEKQNIDISLEQREIFDYVYIELSKRKNEEYAIKLFKQFIKTLDYRIFTRKNKIRDMLVENKITPLVMKKIIYEEMKNALINASIETTKKYDIVQLGRALYGIKNNDYSAFTNNNNARNNLRLMVNKDEIDDLLKAFVENSSNSIDDNYWVFIELISKKINEK